MSLSLRNWKKYLPKIIWAVILVALSACLIHISNWEDQYYTEKEHSPRPTVINRAEENPVDESEITPSQIREYTVPSTHPRYLSIEKLNIQKARIA